PLPERQYLDGTTVIEMSDAEGASLTGDQLLDLPLGNSWLSGFETQSAEFQVTSYNPDTFRYDILASARFTLTSYETTLATPMLYPTQSYIYPYENDDSVTITVKRAGDAS